MMRRRVFLIWTNPLFHESARLLLEHPDIVWAGSGSDQTTLREEILALKPDTILFERTTASMPAIVMELINQAAQEVRIIGLSLEDDEVNLYHHEREPVLEAADLLQFVLGHPTN